MRLCISLDKVLPPKDILLLPIVAKIGGKNLEGREWTCSKADLWLREHYCSSWFAPSLCQSLPFSQKKKPPPTVFLCISVAELPRQQKGERKRIIKNIFIIFGVFDAIWGMLLNHETFINDDSRWQPCLICFSFKNPHCHWWDKSYSVGRFWYRSGP